MEQSADWIMRRAGFGFSLTSAPITQREWIDKTIKGLNDPSNYIKDNRFLLLDALLKDKLPPEEAKNLSGIVRSATGSIIYRQTYQDRQNKLRDNGDIKAANRLWDTHLKTRPLWLATHRRFDFAINTQHDFLNRLWLFWLNYFTVADANGNLPSIPNYHETIRRAMFGRMDSLTYEVITHPAMLAYLDNNRSAGVNSIARKKNWTKDGLNENLARELLELYTLRPASGYTQDDVNGVANVLTGWTIKSWNGNYGVEFEPNRHEPYAQKVLGKTYAGNGLAGKHKLKRLVKDLCANSATSVTVSYRLCQHFINDTPSQDHIKQLSNAYDKSKGDLTQVYIALLNILDTLPHEHNKFLNPEVWAYQCFRTLNVNVFDRVPRDSHNLYLTHINSVLEELGMLHGLAPQPNGWPETKEGWLSNEYLDRRFRFADLFSGFTSGYKSELLADIIKRGLSEEQLNRFGLSQRTKRVIMNVDIPRDGIVALLVSPEFLGS